MDVTGFFPNDVLTTLYGQRSFRYYLKCQGRHLDDNFEIDDQIKALVDRYSNEVMIEQLSMCGWSLQNRFLAIMIPRFLNQSNAKMEEMKKNHPDISDLLDKRIGLVNQRLKLLENPQENRDEALELMQGLLDQLEN